MQLFCIAHGGRVSSNPNGKEVGFYDVFLTPEGKKDKVLNGIVSGRFRTLQWHGDCVTDIPSDWTHLAYSDKTKYQAVVVDGIHYLIQGDGQAAQPSMLREWFSRDRTWAFEGTDVDEEKVVAEASKNQSYFRNVYEQIFRNFIAIARRERAGLHERY
jgi:GMP synthase-like glutamine amidotransferase